MWRLAVSVGWILAITANSAFAQVSLPLGGYYRPGRCIPVLIESSDQPIQIRAAGAISVEIQPAGHGRTIPFLILAASASSLNVGDREIPIRALLPNEKLVASTLDIDSGIASRIFPGQMIIPVKSDRAYEMLDAMILDRSVDPKQLTEMLANGTAVAMRSSDRPAGDWPWKQMGEYWVLKADIAGPVGAIGGEAAYLPLQSWQPVQTFAFRRRIILASLSVTLLMLATMLIHDRRWSIAAMLVVTLLCGGSIATWSQSQPTAKMVGGAIEVLKDGICQRDTWRYIAAGSEGAKGELSDAVHPVVLNAEHAALMNLWAECQADGSMRWLYTLPPNARLAVLQRSIKWKPTLETISGTYQSPLNELARQSYLSRGMRIFSETSASISEESGTVELWPTVVIGAE